MAKKSITQLRRLVFRSRETADADWNVFVIEAADLGSSSVMSVNVAPRTIERSSQMGTSTQPLDGTFDSLEGSITFLAENWRIIGQALGKWNAATFQGATNDDGNIIYGAGDSLCSGGKYISVVAQGLCDDGSTADCEVARCNPSLSDAIELGSESINEVTLNLNPIIYNATDHANDGYEPYTVRFGAHSLTANERLNVTTGAYSASTSES